MLNPVFPLHSRCFLPPRAIVLLSHFGADYLPRPAAPALTRPARQPQPTGSTVVAQAILSEDSTKDNIAHSQSVSGNRRLPHAKELF